LRTRGEGSNFFLSGKVIFVVAVAEAVELLVPIAIGMVVLEVVVTNPTIDYGLWTIYYEP